MTNSLRLQRTLNCPIARAGSRDPRRGHLKNWFFSNDITIVSSDFAPLTSKTWRTEMKGDGTQISVTLQSTTPDDPANITEVQQGWQAALENLAQYLANG